jgi:uridine kinase
MTQNDTKLIRAAQRTHYTRWYDIDNMIEKSDSTEAETQLKAIKRLLYHMEEYYAGVL